MLRGEGAGHYPLLKVQRALPDYQASMTGGKQLLMTGKK